MKNEDQKLRIIHGDAFKVLPKLDLANAVITSLPDANELNAMPLDEYRDWLDRAVALCLSAVRDDGVCVLYQTDRKANGCWYDKAGQIINLAERLSYRLLFHKIVLRHERLDSIDLYRPGYSHLLAFSKLGKVGKTTPDVMPAGGFVWSYGMGIAATRFAVEYARNFGDELLIDPFCGRGTVPAVAEGMFKQVIGIDIDAKCCAASRNLRL